MKHKVSICHQNCIHIYNQTPVFERVGLMTFCSASSACMQHTVCPTYNIGLPQRLRAEGVLDYSSSG